MRALTPADFIFLIFAVRWTILLSVMAIAGGGCIGLGLAFAATSPHPVRRWSALVYIRLFQGTPLLLQLFLIFFGSDMLGFPLPAWISAMLAFSLNAGAFMGEIWRGCIEQVARGQWEAALALGLRRLALMFKVVIPQAIRLAAAPTVGYLVGLIKNTSLAAIIGFVELTRAGQLLNNATFHPFLLFGLVAFVYLLLCFPLTVISQRIETRFSSAYKH